MDYQAYLGSEHWRRTRLRRLKRDGFQCRKCSATKKLQVHHLTYKRLGRERITDLMTLCDSCHQKVHKQVFQELPPAWVTPSESILVAAERNAIERKAIERARNAEIVNRRGMRAKDPSSWRKPDISSPFRYLKEKS